MAAPEEGLEPKTDWLGPFGLLKIDPEGPIRRPAVSRVPMLQRMKIKPKIFGSIFSVFFETFSVQAEL